MLNRPQVPTDVVFLIVLWRLRLKLSLRDLAEILLLRGLVFSHEAAREWEAKPNLNSPWEARCGAPWRPASAFRSPSRSAAAGLILALILVHRRRLPDEVGNLTPSLHWPAPVVARDPDLERGPVLITIEYRVPPNRTAAFVDAMEAMRRMRRRDGAFSWGLFEDTAQPGRWLEAFEVETWVEHLRQHERVTHADRAVQERVNAFHTGSDGPAVTHLLAPDRDAFRKDAPP